jgi:hypothetical protein
MSFLKQLISYVDSSLLKANKQKFEGQKTEEGQRNRNEGHCATS